MNIIQNSFHGSTTNLPQANCVSVVKKLLLLLVLQKIIWAFTTYGSTKTTISVLCHSSY